MEFKDWPVGYQIHPLVDSYTFNPIYLQFLILLRTLFDFPVWENHRDRELLNMDKYTPLPISHGELPAEYYSQDMVMMIENVSKFLHKYI